MTKAILLFIFSTLYFTVIGQGLNPPAPLIEDSIARKITVAGFCLCNTSVDRLQKLTTDLKEVEVEEMDLPKNCYGQDTRFENGKGYYSDKYPGIIFQKDPNTYYISKIRLTKDFKGTLPDGMAVDLSKLTLKDVFKVHPELTEKWSSRGCSNYWNIGNDTISFFVKIDPDKKPQYPVDEEYYSQKPIEAIDIKISCHSLYERARERSKLLADREPLFFIDSVSLERSGFEHLNPSDIASITVYRDSSAVRMFDEKGKNGVVFIETKKFARKRYWNFFAGKSTDYLKIIPTPESDSTAVYILNGKVLKKDFEADLSGITNETFIDLKVIDRVELEKKYNVTGKEYGVVVSVKKK